MNPINSLALFTRLQKGEPLNLPGVREKTAYQTYNIGGKNIPLSGIENNIGKTGYNKTDEIIVICKAGLRSETARPIFDTKWLPAGTQFNRRTNVPAKTKKVN